MNLLCWNYQGLGNFQTKQKLGDLIQAQDPLVVFLVETWLNKASLEDIRVQLNFGGMIEVSREAQEGVGLLFFGKRMSISLQAPFLQITLMEF